jgi:phosphoadenosine phosphosulfate reductase
MLTKVEYEQLASGLKEGMSAASLIEWALSAVPHNRLVVTTGFGMEGCALVDMFAEHGVPVQVAYLDTGFLFAETYELRDRLVARYPLLSFVDRGTSLGAAEQAALYGDELWARNPDLCCSLRKVQPMALALANAAVWVTALTRSQSASRAATALFAWDERYEVLKLAPLAGWDRAQVWEYVQSHNVPYNPLHERGYPSIGCVQCTRRVAATRITDYSREGRWAGRSKTECGLHDASRGRSSR